MPYCPACRAPIRGERERVGARCPRCRLPLYERPELFKPRAAGDSFCSVHPQNPAVGPCQRCGNFQCDVCRTRWHNRALCAACVGRLLEEGAADPHEVRAERLQSMLALLLGIISWVLVLVGLVIAVAAVAVNGPRGLDAGVILLVGVGVLVMLASVLPAAFGIGQGAAALRARGSHMILATIGLILSGLDVGAVIGLFTFAYWQS
jgi:hypothetical protein